MGKMRFGRSCATHVIFREETIGEDNDEGLGNVSSLSFKITRNTHTHTYTSQYYCNFPAVQNSHSGSLLLETYSRVTYVSLRNCSAVVVVVVFGAESPLARDSREFVKVYLHSVTLLLGVKL